MPGGKIPPLAGKRRKKNKCSGVVVWVIYTLPMIMMMTIPAIRPGEGPTNTQQI